MSEEGLNWHFPCSRDCNRHCLPHTEPYTVIYRIYNFTFVLGCFALNAVVAFFCFLPCEGATDSVNMLSQKYTEDSVGLFSFLFIF